jgi:hypothetical protein
VSAADPIHPKFPQNPFRKPWLKNSEKPAEGQTPAALRLAEIILFSDTATGSRAAMISARRYSPTNSYFFTWILRHSYRWPIFAEFISQGHGLEVFDRVKPPFILVGNHSTFWIPSSPTTSSPHPIHWCKQRRNHAIPYHALSLDQTCRIDSQIEGYPRYRNSELDGRIIYATQGSVGLYPEGQSSWNGDSLPVFGSTAKLIRL